MPICQASNPKFPIRNSAGIQKIAINGHRKRNQVWIPISCPVAYRMGFITLPLTLASALASFLAHFSFKRIYSNFWYYPFNLLWPKSSIDFNKLCHNIWVFSEKRRKLILSEDGSHFDPYQNCILLFYMTGSVLLPNPGTNFPRGRQTLIQPSFCAGIITINI